MYVCMKDVIFQLINKKASKWNHSKKSELREENKNNFGYVNCSTQKLLLTSWNIGPYLHGPSFNRAHALKISSTHFSNLQFAQEVAFRKNMSKALPLVVDKRTCFLKWTALFNEKRSQSASWPSVSSISNVFKSEENVNETKARQKQGFTL